MTPAAATISEAVDAIRSGELLSREVVAACLGRITALEPDVRAWARVCGDDALAAADHFDALPTETKKRLPLGGIPVGIKDIIATRGLETSAGSRILRGWVPQEDADAVARLRKAGAIVLGKTETTEFAGPDPAPTRNPYDLAHTPGGSSAGSAAAVAAGMCLGALGTQTAGSVLRPAAYCGVVGFKPTYDAISRRGVLPLAWSLDHVGAMAATVSDVRLLLKAASAAPLSDESPWAAPRIGIPIRFFEPASSDIADAMDHAVETLRSMGISVTTVELPESFAAVGDAGRVVLASEASAAHQSRYVRGGKVYGPLLEQVIEAGREVPAPSYVQAQRVRRVATEDIVEVFSDIDLLLTPATPTPAPRGLQSTGDPSFNSPFSTLGLPALGIPIPGRRNGMPVALQLVARHGLDLPLLDFGVTVEQRLAADGWTPQARRDDVQQRLSRNVERPTSEPEGLK